MSIEIQALTKKYGKQTAVNAINVSIPKGEIVGFLGPNGAGKSTTMKMLTCYIPPTSGSAKVCGFDVLDNSLDVRKHVGYLPEHNPLYLDMFVREYLDFAASLSGVKTNKKLIDEIIEKTGLQVEQKKKLGQLSKGYRQRAGLAQAIIHNPDVLILDEPTSGLDPNQVIEIRDLIKNLGKEKTILLSTHIMQEVEAICDRVIIINKGIIVADDKLKNLQQHASNKNTVRVQFAKNIDAKKLQNITANIQVIEEKNCVYKIIGTDENLRQKVSHFALENDLEVLELVTEKNSLEDIFRNVTNNVDRL